MLLDMKKYTKFFAIEKNAPNKKWACTEFQQLLKNLVTLGPPTGGHAMTADGAPRPAKNAQFR